MRERDSDDTSAHFHALAEAELNEAAAYYARAREGLGHAFLTEVARSLNELCALPLTGTLVNTNAFGGGS